MPLIISAIVVLSGCGNAAFGDISFTYKVDGTKEIIEERKQKVEKNVEKDLEDIDTVKSQFEKGYYDYKGTINRNIPIEMSIYPLEKEIVGSYFYKTQEKKIKLEGKAGEKEIILYEYDEKGKNTGMFKGTMKTVDKIEGTWISGDGKKQYPFTLSLKSIIPGAEYGKRYRIALNTKNDQDVENFVVHIQDYIAKGNKEELSEQLIYPITVNVNGTKTKVENKDEFIKNYDKIFHAEYKKEMSNASTKYLFANAKGLMFGEGSYNLWINEVISGGDNSKLAITAINN